MKQRILASALLAIFTTVPAFAGTHALLPAQAGDMVPTTLLARTANPVAATRATSMINPRTPQMHKELRPISVNWALPHDSPVDSTATPFVRPSRAYWIDVAATDLQRGIQLPLSAPGALIRLSPGDAQGGRLDPAKVQLRLGSQSMNLQQASNTLADAASLHAAGMDVPQASIVLKLKPELGSGLATLQAPAASGRYVVYVLEPQSPFSVAARGDRSDVLLGNQVQVRVTMHDADKTAPLAAVGGFLRAPDGTTTTLAYQRQPDGSFITDAQPRNIPTMPGLWEVHSFTSGTDSAGHEVRRDTTTVFAAATPTARFSGIAKTSRSSDHGIDIALGVTAASASRFAASAVLYGRAANGSMVPAAFAQSAAVLRKGDGKLVLHFDPGNIEGVGAPFELRDLRLQDQPAVSLIERQALAMRFDTP